MLKPRGNNPFETFVEYGRKQATTFSGFCGYHDATLFKDIETGIFKSSDWEIFLYTYRTLAAQLHAKEEAVKQQQQLADIFKKRNNEILDAFKSGASDLEFDKRKMDEFILGQRPKSPVTSIIWRFNQKIDFAGSAFYSPIRNF
ncbi:hypothetical protein [Furfurilactobacillus curtus]|uniref:Uncharacterized protein n=1 Tax=Furfurilactobacillus curtus TaxID=1746200 RepID=A0ABQ5JPB0_9LACO